MFHIFLKSLSPIQQGYQVSSADHPEYPLPEKASTIRTPKLCWTRRSECDLLVYYPTTRRSNNPSFLTGIDSSSILCSAHELFLHTTLKAAFTPSAGSARTKSKMILSTRVFRSFKGLSLSSIIGSNPEPQVHGPLILGER
ncbi:hypothetical protein K443DRAFT_9841 [Laccaria amethystina LaAM-08-1]|uniref:Uncharacterized protein n=1 Tax=Laccaria amethystina LaAM-08-1 TaxID=1095629 RepID=A0A0C9X840_9AGAR|nr:hypothetical protein K443DRAFT_9841 [Laccaria amethystina LaAM-08-1]